LVLFLNRRYLIPICWTLIVLAPIYRAGATYLTHDGYANTLLPGVMDCLAAGALLALAPLRISPRVTFEIGLVGCLLTFEVFGWGTESVVSSALVPTLLLPFFCWLIPGAAQGFGGVLGWVLSHPALRYIGRISYGMYVIHYLTMPLMWRTESYLNPYVRSLVLSVLTVTLASLSWYFYERPINRLRDRISLARWFGRRPANAVTGEPDAPQAAAAAATPGGAEAL
jgi:peptidoglycan/LPS O-acetylase OafA/YrhL